jgi:hypothetical protein
MPTATSIVLADAQATPVNHTFIPIGRDTNNVFWFEDQSMSNSIGFWRISVEQKRPSAASAGTSSNQRTYRVKIGLHEPILEVPGPGAAPFDPAPTVAYVSRRFTEYIDPERSSLQNRKDMSKMGPLLEQNSLIQAVLNNHEELTF